METALALSQDGESGHGLPPPYCFWCRILPESAFVRAHAEECLEQPRRLFCKVTNVVEGSNMVHLDVLCLEARFSHKLGNTRSMLGHCGIGRDPNVCLI